MFIRENLSYVAEPLPHRETRDDDEIAAAALGPSRHLPGHDHNDGHKAFRGYLELKTRPNGRLTQRRLVSARTAWKTSSSVS